MPEPHPSLRETLRALLGYHWHQRFGIRNYLRYRRDPKPGVSWPRYLALCRREWQDCLAMTRERRDYVSRYREARPDSDTVVYKARGPGCQ